jgi:CBS domain containing-hemolysin-like protein
LGAAVAVAIIGALFACADAALTSMSAARLGALAKETDDRHRPAMDRAARRRPTLQSRYVIGRVLSQSISVALFTWWLVGWNAAQMHKTIVAACALVGLVALVQAASAVGRRSADWVLKAAIRFLRPLELLVAPIAAVTDDFTGLLTRYRRATPDPRIGEAEMEMMVDEGERSGLLQEAPAEMMRNVLEFSELTVRDAMVPRTRVVSIELRTPLEDVLGVIRQEGHSRYPVYRDHTDEVVGLLYAKDLFRQVRASWRPPDGATVLGDVTEAANHSTLADVIRAPITIVYESQPLATLLKEMRQSRQHLAVVVNEFGGMSGIVTLEDVLEEIVGDIRDETDSEEAPIVELGDGRLLADAAVLLSDLSAYLGTDIDPEEHYDSLAGMLTEQLGEVPAVGATVAAHGMRFVVREADEKRVAKVEIVRPPRASMQPPAATAG